MSTRRDTPGASWDDTVAHEPLDGSDRTLGSLDLPPADPALVQRVLARVPDDERHRDWGVVLPLREAVRAELEPMVGPARRTGEPDRGEVVETPGPGAGPAAASVVVLVVLMVSAWLPTLASMRQGFDGAAWSWAVVAGLLVSLGCAALLATPRLTARPVARDWQRGTGFGLVAVASTVLLASVLFRLYGGSSIEDDTVPQFVLLVAVPVVAVAAWLLLRDRTSHRGRGRRAGADDGTTSVRLARVEALEQRLGTAVEQLSDQASTGNDRAALAVELAGLRQLFEAGRLEPDVARTAATEAASHWRAR